MSEAENHNITIIFGVGNPGKKFARTRLNAGMIVVDKIAQQLANIYPRQASFDWRITGKYMLLAIKGDPFTILVKPRTYLADIGKAVKHLANFYFMHDGVLNLESFYVCFYDTSQPLNEYEIEQKSGNNEIEKKITQSLGDGSYWKIRIGVGGESFGESKDQYLKRELDDKEYAYMRSVAEKISKELDLIEVPE